MPLYRAVIENADRVATMATQTPQTYAGHVRGGHHAGGVPVARVGHGPGQRQALVVSDEVVAYVHKLAEQLVPGGRGSSFADEVAPSPDADPMERLAAFSGRRPVAA